MNLRKKVSSDSLYTEFVNILNGVLQLSKRESEVLSFILAADANGFSNNVNSKVVRSAIMYRLGISESNLSRYLNTLKVKNLIVRDNSSWVVNDYIRPTLIDGVVEVNITLLLNEQKVSGETYKAVSEEVQ